MGQGWKGALFRESDYERARQWLEEYQLKHDIAVSRAQFLLDFNRQLYDAKGAEWTREGLILDKKTEAKKARKATLTYQAQVKRERRRAPKEERPVRLKAGQRFERITVKGKSVPRIRDKKTGRFVKIRRVRRSASR